MSDEPEHFLTSLHVHDSVVGRNLEIPIASEDGVRRHLILTGPSGSGKSTILRGLHLRLLREQRAWLAARSRPAAALEAREGPGTTAADEREPRWPWSRGRFGARGRPHEDHPPVVEARGSLAARLPGHRMLLAFMPADRRLVLRRPEGPRSLTGTIALEHPSHHLLQFLVNQRTELAYAREAADAQAVARLVAWLETFEGWLRELLGDPEARLEIDRVGFHVRIRLGDGRPLGLDRPPDGVAGVLQAWASLMIPSDRLRRSGIERPRGWALVDEPELHLHPRLQQMVLPFLTKMFPSVQLIVATHSPAVVASLSDATVFDLGTRQALDSADLHGIRYGTILTEHFGIEADFDLETTRKLEALKKLSDEQPDPGTEAFEQMRALARELGDVPHLLVARVNKRLYVARGAP